MTEETHGDVITTTWNNTKGLPVRIQQGNQTTTHIYDPAGNCIATTDPEGYNTYRKFDELGRLEQKTLPDGAVISYEYDADSNLIVCHMPGNLSWKATYDLMGCKTSEWLEADSQISQQWKYSYINGQLSQSIDPMSRIHTYTYDDHSRLIEESVDKEKRFYTYDERGLITSAKENNSTVEREYDASGRIIGERIILNGKLIQQTQQSWTPSSRTLQIGDHQRDFLYEAGRLKSLSSNGMNLSYEYKINGSLTKKTTPFSVVNLHYNNSGLPEAIHTQLFNHSYEETVHWTTSDKLASHEATYPDYTNTSYTYSSRGYLKTANDQSFGFDFGQPGRGIRTSAPNATVPSNGLDPFGKISTMTYDLMGQVTVRGKDRLVWDVWGRLVEVSNETYTWTASYDAFGRRLQTSYTPLIKGYLWNSKGKSTITTSLYDPEDEFLEIGVISAGKTFWKFYGNSSCDAIVDNKGKTSILTHDIKDNLINVISSEDVQWASYYLSPYGPLDPGSVEFTPDSLTWQSKRSDPTGLIWMGARYYDPREGCFLSPDPISYPVCLDLYTYANGDPINNFDPDGRYTSPILKDIGMTVADAFFSNRFQGSMRAMGGLTEAIAGGSFALASLETGIGAVAGFAVMAHGLDNFQAGFHQAWNNVSRDPATVQLLQKAGMSHNVSHMTNDFGMMLGTMGVIASTNARITQAPTQLTKVSIHEKNNVKGILKVGDFSYTKSAGRHFSELIERGQYMGQLERPYMRSQLFIREIMSTGKGIPDAFVEGGINWKIPGTFRGSKGFFELGMKSDTNIIYHFNYTK